MSNVYQREPGIGTCDTLDDPPAESTKRSRSTAELFRSRSILIVAFVVLVIAAFANTVGGGFVYDDLPMIVDSPLMANWQPATIKLLLTSDVGSSFRMEQGVSGPYYRPVFVLFLMVVHSVVGNNAAGWHIVSIGLHLLACILVFLLLRRLLAESLDQDRASIIAALATAIFAVHPVQAESVAWISGSTGPLSTLFFLGSFYSYLMYRSAEGRRRNLWLATACLLSAVALFSKESCVVLILVVLLYEIFYRKPGADTLRGRVVSGLRQAVPFAATTAAYFIIRASLLGVSFSVQPSANYPDDAALTLGERIQTIPSLAASYLRLAFVPAGLSPAYDLGYLREISISAFWLPLAALLVVGVLLFLLSKRHREFRLAVILAAIPLAPHFNVTAFPSGELLHDRYLYLPLVGVGLMVALLIETVALRIKLPFAPVAAAKAGLVVVLLAMTIGQNKIWASNEVLWTHAVKHAPDSRVARLWLGSMAEDRQDLETALGHYNAVLSIHPDVLDALNNSAFVYAHMKRWPEAIRNFERVVSIVPLQAISHFNLSVAYAAARRYAEEARELRAAIELAGDNPQAAEWRSRLEYLTDGALRAPVEKGVSR